jgi:hypothetical protein
MSPTPNLKQLLNFQGSSSAPCCSAWLWRPPNQSPPLLTSKPSPPLLSSNKSPTPQMTVCAGGPGCMRDFLGLFCMHTRWVFFSQTCVSQTMIFPFLGWRVVPGGKECDPMLEYEICALLALWWWVCGFCLRNTGPMGVP